MSTVRFANEVKFHQFKHIKIEVVPASNSVWVYLDPKPRPCITVTLLKELAEFQSILKHNEGKLPSNGEMVDIDYHIVTSNHSVFNFGGDLEYFLKCIHNKDRDALRNYAYSCIDTLYPNYSGFDLDITTISLINGNALGGGFEAALSSHVLIAEKKAEMGLPEVLFNLFPGMGGYNFIAQKSNAALAEKMIMSGRLYNSEDLYEKGIIDVLAEDGEGVAAVNSFMRANRKCSNTRNALRKVRQSINPVDYQNLIDICDIWVESAFNISDKDLRTMARLVRSQEKFVAHKNEAKVSLENLV